MGGIWVPAAAEEMSFLHLTPRNKVWKLYVIFKPVQFPQTMASIPSSGGANADKCRLATMYYKGQKKVLEIGFSVGNVSQTILNLSKSNSRVSTLE